MCLNLSLYGLYALQLITSDTTLIAWAGWIMEFPEARIGECPSLLIAILDWKQQFAWRIADDSWIVVVDSRSLQSIEYLWDFTRKCSESFYKERTCHTGVTWYFLNRCLFGMVIDGFFPLMDVHWQLGRFWWWLKWALEVIHWLESTGRCLFSI